MSSARPIVECAGVGKRFGTVEVLRGVDLEVTTGELLTVSGPSGGGKSTLLHLLAALDRPTEGTIVVNGKHLDRLRAVNQFRRHDVGIVFQLHNLLPHMQARQNVELAMIGSGRSPRERHNHATEILEALDLGQALQRTPTRLSGGERQRVAIARALANDPVVLLADEPTGSLDPVSAALVLDMIDERRHRNGMTVIMATHDARVIERSSRHLELSGGRLHPAA